MTITSAINTWAQLTVTSAAESAATVMGPQTLHTETAVVIDARPGEVYFLRTEFTAPKQAPAAKLVTAADGARDIAGLHLAAGGRGRYPVNPW